MSDPPLIELGGFILQDPLHRVAGARVWRARHDPSGLPVWVTVHGGRSARKPAVRDALLSAWQRIVGIEHPGVVPPLAMGVMPDAPTLAARGLPAGAPWVAAPMPRGGTLRDLLAGGHGAGDEETAIAVRWPVARTLLRSLLDTLAHAHAAGCLHLDLRPAHLWLDATPGGPRAPGVDPLQRLALSGWSAPRALGGADKALVSGEVGRMPPEQVDGDWRTLGPWSDLYAVGVLAWELVSGARPFPGDNLRAVLFRQLQSGPGPFRARFPVPAGLEGWLRVLLSPDAADRFACAADARRALQALGPVVQPEDVAVLDAPTRRVDAGRFEELARGRPAPDATFPVPRTRPVRWTDAARSAGARLAPLRDAPAPIQPQLASVLWARLQTVHRTGQGHSVVLEGPPERGGPRAARWLLRAGQEAGLALHLVHVRCGPGPTTQRGFGPALGRTLRVQGLRADALEHALAKRLAALGATEPWLAPALAHHIHPEGPTLGQAPSLAMVATCVLAALSAHRPVVLWLEDAEDDAEARDTAGHLRRRQRAAPMRLLILQTRSLRLTEQPGEERIVVSAPATRRRTVDPDGAPQEAEAEPQLRRRIEDALGGPDDPRRGVAEAGAVLGRTIPLEAWRALSGDAAAGVGLALASSGLAVPNGLDDLPGWTLRPAALRRVLLDDAARQGRLAGVHRALARQLGRARPQSAALLGDLAWHRLASGDPGSAWAAAARATRSWHEQRRPWRAREAIHVARQALDQTGARAGRRRDELRLLEAEVALAIGQPEEADRALQRSAEVQAPDLAARARVLQGEAASALGRGPDSQDALASGRAAALEQGLVGLYVRASFALARLHLQRGQPARAVPVLREVLALPPIEDDPNLPARARVALSAAARANGDPVEAGAQLRQASRETDAIQDPALRVQVRCEQARVHLLRKRTDEALRVLDQALSLAQELGAAEILAETWAELGTARRAAGDFAEAERAFRLATTWAQTAGRSETLALIRLARVQSARGDHGEARDRIEAALQRCTRLGEPVWIPVCTAAMVEIAAGQGDWMVFDLRRAELARGTWAGVAHLHEIAHPLERAGSLASAMGQAARAQAAWELAARLWSDAGQEARAVELRGRAGALEESPTEEAPRWVQDAFES